LILTNQAKLFAKKELKRAITLEDVAFNFTISVLIVDIVALLFLFGFRVALRGMQAS